MKYARDFREEALSVLTGRWGLAIGASLLYSILNGGLTGVFTNRIDYSPLLTTNQDFFWDFLTPLIPIYAVIFIISIIFSAIGSSVQLGYYSMNLKFYDPNQTPRIGDLFIRFRIFWKAFGLRLLMGLFVFLWTLLFIIPGIIASYRYAMAPYIMAENPDIGILEAINRSKQLMDGNKWRLFCLILSFIGWGILAVFTCGIGFLWLIPYQMLAETAFYREISGKNAMVFHNPGTDPYGNNNYTVQ